MIILKRFMGVVLLFVICLWGAFCYFVILIFKGFEKALAYDTVHEARMDNIINKYLEQ